MPGAAPVAFLLFNAPANAFKNDVITAANRQVVSAPSLFARSIPTGEYDLIFQGPRNTLCYYHGARPASGAPAFTGSKIGGVGSTYGG